MIGTIFKGGVSLLACVLAYVFALSLALSIGQTNPASRLAQLAFAFVFSYSVLCLFWKRLQKAFAYRKFKLLVLGLMLSGYAPLEMLVPSPFSAIPATVLLLIPFRWKGFFPKIGFSIPAFKVRLWFVHILWVRYRIFEYDTSPINISYESALGVGFSEESALRMVARKGRKLIRAGKIPFPAHENERELDSRNHSLLIEPDMEAMMCLGFSRNRVLCLLDVNDNYEGYVDVRADLNDAGCFLTVLGSQPTLMSYWRYFLLKETWGFVGPDRWEKRGIKQTREKKFLH